MVDDNQLELIEENFLFDQNKFHIDIQMEVGMDEKGSKFVDEYPIKRKSSKH